MLCVRPVQDQLQAARAQRTHHDRINLRCPHDVVQDRSEGSVDGDDRFDLTPWRWFLHELRVYTRARVVGEVLATSAMSKSTCSSNPTFISIGRPERSPPRERYLAAE
jgi:hypothetical protein